MGNKEFVIEIDVDGTLIDDVGRAFEKRMIRGGTAASNAFREGVYNLVKLVRGSSASHELDVSASLLTDTLSYAKQQIGTPGRSVRFRTKNPFSDLEIIINSLELAGIRNPDVKRFDPREEKPKLRVQDDTRETWKSVLDDGVETIHRGGTHSSLLGRMSSKINHKIHFVTDMNDGRASRITDEVAERSSRNLSFA